MAVNVVDDSFDWGQAFWNMQNDGFLCDLHLQGSEPNAKELPVHRVVLAARSPYFKAMFSSDMQESRQEHVQLRNISSASLNMIVEFVYTSAMTIDEDNVAPLLEAAIFADLQFLVERCWKFLEEHTDPDNCLLVHGLAERYQRTDLAKITRRQVLRHFPTAVQSEAFLLLEKDKVIALLGLDDIIVELEDVVLDAVFSWISYDPTKRIAVLPEVMAMVRLAHVKPEFLQRSVTEFIDQMGHCVADLSQLIQQSIQSASSVDWQPRESCEFTQAFLCFGATVSCIHPRSGVRTTLSPAPEGLTPTGTAALGRYVFVLGTLGGSPVLCSYDIDLYTWMILAPPYSAHFGGGVVALAGRVFAVGGINDRTVECFDPETNLWQRVNDLPVYLFEFGYVVCQGSLFTFGGANGPDEAQRVLRYEPETDVWTECSHMPTPRHNCSVCLGDDDMIYVLGGTTTGGGTKFAHRFDAYNPLTNEWQRRDDLPTSGRRLAVAAVDGHMYVLGGCNQQTYNSTMDQSPQGIQAYSEFSQTWSSRTVSWPASFLSTLESSVCAVVKLKKGLELKEKDAHQSTAPSSKRGIDLVE